LSCVVAAAVALGDPDVLSAQAPLFPLTELSNQTPAGVGHQFLVPTPHNELGISVM